MEVEPTGKVRLSRKALLERPQVAVKSGGDRDRGAEVDAVGSRPTPRRSRTRRPQRTGGARSEEADDSRPRAPTSVTSGAEPDGDPD